MAGADTKARIPEAAGRVVLARGVAGLTLEAVADEAGLSKGGLLYHYGSKEALLGAMVARLIDATEARIAGRRATDDAPGSWTRGYVDASAPDGGSGDDPTGRLGIAVLAAGATDPALVAPLRDCQADWHRRLHDDGIDPVTALVVRLAADGLWFNDIFGLPVLDSAERRLVLARLEALTR